MDKVSIPDIDRLTKILIASKLVSSYKRSNLLSKIGVDSNFAERNIDNYNDEDFAEILIDYLEQTKQLQILINLCQQIESVIKTGRENLQLKSIKKRIKIFNVVLLYLESNQKFFNHAYKMSLSHHDIHIQSDSYPMKSLENLDINEVIKNIGKLDNYKTNNFSLLDFFVGYLTINIQNKSSQIYKYLEAWLKFYTNHDDLIKNIQQKINTKNQKKEDYDPCLLITIEDGNNDHLIIKAWFIEDTKTYPISHQCQPLNINLNQHIIHDLTWKSLENQFSQILDNLLSEINTNQEINDIQLFLPYKYIIPIDKFFITREEDEYYLGAYYRVSIRLLERIKPITNSQERDYKNRWINKSKTLKNHIEQCNFNNLLDIFYPFNFAQKSSKSLKNEFRKEDKLATRLTCAIENDKTEEMIKILYFTGIPVALWVRENFENHQNDLCDMISEVECLKMLSKLVKEKRQEADERRAENNHNLIGNHLYFLWDDADLIPYNQEVKNQLSIP